MYLLLSDCALPQHLPERETYHYIDVTQHNIKHCLGCFGCWTKTPGKCVIRDDAHSIYTLIAKSQYLIYVSRLYCGSYDVPMKTILERAIPIQQAFIRLHDGETHHIQRDVAQKHAVIIAYGDIPEQEQRIFSNLVQRNAKNMNFKSYDIKFVSESELSKTIQSEVEQWETYSLSMQAPEGHSQIQKNI